MASSIRPPISSRSSRCPSTRRRPGNIPLHRIAHQWGHAIGLGHTYERADRDRYVRFDPAVWCWSQPGFAPPVRVRARRGRKPADRQRHLRRLRREVEDERIRDRRRLRHHPSPTRPRASRPPADAAAVEELFYSQTLGLGAVPTPGPGRCRPHSRSTISWSRGSTRRARRRSRRGRRPRSRSSCAARMAAFTASAIRYPHRCSWDGRTGSWSPAGWTRTPRSSLPMPNTLHLAVRATDKSIRLRTRTMDTWGLLGVAWCAAGRGRIGARHRRARHPIAQRPRARKRRSGYEFTCTDPVTMCAASAAAADAWTPLPSGVAGQTKIISKPSADWTPTAG